MGERLGGLAHVADAHLGHLHVELAVHRFRECSNCDGLVDDELDHLADHESGKALPLDQRLQSGVAHLQGRGAVHVAALGEPMLWKSRAGQVHVLDGAGRLIEVLGLQAGRHRFPFHLLVVRAHRAGTRRALLLQPLLDVLLGRALQQHVPDEGVREADAVDEAEQHLVVAVEIIPDGKQVADAARSGARLVDGKIKALSHQAAKGGAFRVLVGPDDAKAARLGFTRRTAA